MVEGHGVHRVAVTHRRALVGKKFAATSPNGKFSDGARAIDGVPLRKVEVIGKNMFYKFGNQHSPSQSSIMHVHFGMSGRFGVFAAETAPEVTGNTRLKLEGHGMTALLSAMTVNLIDEITYDKKCKDLGQDPLREDACPETLWSKFSKSRKSVGAALMDQAMFAGVGNIYRAEILYKAGVHPDERCVDVDREIFDTLWHHTVELLQRGFVNGSILTVDPEEALILGDPWTRRYVYNQTKCGRCLSSVKTWDIANRTVYACETCQPLKVKNESQKKSSEKSENKTLFVSHCAPDSASTTALEPSKLTVAQLKDVLDTHGWPKGLQKIAKKSLLVEAVLKCSGDETKIVPKKEKPQSVSQTQSASPQTPSSLKPGTKALESQMNSARAAAFEKIAAGEKGNVEHVALADDETLLVKSAAEKSKVSPAKRRRATTGPVTPDAVEKTKRRTTK